MSEVGQVIPDKKQISKQISKQEHWMELFLLQVEELTL